MALVRAAQRGECAAVVELLQIGQFSGFDTWLALSAAAANDWPDTVAALLGANVRPNSISRTKWSASPSSTFSAPTSTALFWASSFGSTKSVAQLLSSGAHVEGCGGTWHTTALGIASRKGHAPVVKTLLAAKARPDGFVCFGSCDPLAEAIRGGHKEVEALLSAACATPRTLAVRL